MRLLCASPDLALTFAPFHSSYQVAIQLTKKSPNWTQHFLLSTYTPAGELIGRAPSIAHLVCERPCIKHSMRSLAVVEATRRPFPVPSGPHLFHRCPDPFLNRACPAPGAPSRLASYCTFLPGDLELIGPRRQVNRLLVVGGELGALLPRRIFIVVGHVVER
jgi:hypothetical protein